MAPTYYCADCKELMIKHYGKSKRDFDSHTGNKDCGGIQVTSTNPSILKDAGHSSASFEL